MASSTGLCISGTRVDPKVTPPLSKKVLPHNPACLSSPLLQVRQLLSYPMHD